jgi:hypothetical protein
MTRLAASILALSSLAVGFVLGWAVATVPPMLRPYEPFGVVAVKNASGKEIQSLEIKHPHGSVAINGLSPGQQRTLAFYVPGEGSYTIKAFFPDGTMVSGGVGYIESGYHGTDTIFSDRIESKYESSRQTP